jgi:3-hydroxymyristoyl/3-hydroxydecanoyl-(acyl carrier protein) dehydratase
VSVIKSNNKPTIIAQYVADNSVTLQLFIDPELIYFKGHFNHYPILAGVVQLDWAIHYGKALLGSDTVFAGMEVIKFQQPILPNLTVLLTLRWDKEKQKLYFSYTSGEDNNHSSGRIKLDMAK